MKLPAIKKDIGYFLRVFRATYGFSQGKAAKMFKMSASHWSLLEDGRRNASPELAQELAKVTGAPIELFLGLQKVVKE